MSASYLVDGMVPWPRRLINFPIILIVICQQYIWAASILLDPSAMNTTAASVPALFLGQDVFASTLALTATLGVVGFRFRRKLYSVLALVPQQAMLFLSASGAIGAVYTGMFADGVVRTRAFLLVDQCPAILMAFFHMWVMFLILRYTVDR